MSKKTISKLTLLGVGLLNILIYYLYRLEINIYILAALSIFVTLMDIVLINLIFKKYKINGYDDTVDLEVRFYNIDEVSDKVLKYAVIMTQKDDQWIFVRHEERNTWEIPGGRREPEEDIFKTAERELVEETGASQYEIEPLYVYSVQVKGEKSYGLLCYSRVSAFDKPLTLEICEIKAFSNLPNDLTYPLIQPILFKKIVEYLAQNKQNSLANGGENQ